MKDDEKALFIDEKVLFIFCIYICVFAGLMIFAGLKAGHIKVTSETPRFSVVDAYKGCSVVRFIPPGDAKSHYFLDCNK